MSCKIVVISCDKNKDLFDPYHICIEKYWKDHPEIIYSTESVVNPYYKTICLNYDIDSWTKRVLDTIKDLECDHILLMVDDIFLRKPVDNDRFNKLFNFFFDNVASINLEKSFDTNDIPLTSDLLVRSKLGKWKTSVMCNLFDRQKLIDILSVKITNPWTFESDNNHLNYTYLITRYGDILNWGYEFRGWFGIRKGKWCKEIVDFFEKENIEVDYSIRGFYE